MTPYRILMIGNSYTYYNELWDRLTELYAAAGLAVTVDHVTHGGYKLSQMLDREDPDGAAVANKLAENHYDTVILQDHSLRTWKDPDGFYESITEFCNRIRACGATPLLYETWARKQGSKTLSELNTTPKKMTQIVSQAYRNAAKMHRIAVSPVGEAFFEIVCSHPEIELYDPDQTHPSMLGTLLAAMCIFATLTKRTPVGLSVAHTDAETALLLASTAERVCLEI